MIYAVRITDNKWYETLECDCGYDSTPPPLEDEVFYSDSEEESMDTASDADGEGSDESHMSDH